jgi:hypothetical protein
MNGGANVTMSEGEFTIPTYIFLKPDQRRKLEILVRDQGLDLPNVLSELLVDYLNALPDPPTPAEPVADDGREALIRRRRGALQRLRARLTMADEPQPSWVTQYIADLEAEIARLEQGE